MSPSILARTFTIGLGIVLTACGSVTTDLPSSSRAISPSSAATAGPTETSTPAPAPESSGPSVEPSPSVLSASPYAVGTTVQVVANAVQVRSSAGLDGRVVGLLGRDIRASVVSGPAEADGFTWYEIEHSSTRGWVATGDAEDRWIVAVPGIGQEALAFRFRGACDATPPLEAGNLTITAKRTVIGSGPSDGGWLAGRLTEAAFSEFSALIDRPELAQSRDYRPERRPGAGEPPGHGLCVWRFTLGPPEERIHVTSVSWFGDEEEAAYYLPSPERRTLDELARRLARGTGLFSDAAWEVAPAEYRADTYLVWLGTEPDSPAAEAVPVEDLVVLGDRHQFGEAIGSDRCGYLDRARFEQLAEAFRSSRTPAALNAVSYLDVSAEGRRLWFATSPMTPDGFPTCGDIDSRDR